MKQMIELLNKEAMSAFAQAGYEESLGKVTLSNRPDLCEYQCNGAMASYERVCPGRIRGEPWKGDAVQPSGSV